MFNVGGPEVIVIGLLALLVLGPDRLPGALRTVGRFVGDLRRMSTDVQQDLRDTLDAEGMRESVQVLRDTVGIGRALVEEAVATAGAVTAAATGTDRSAPATRDAGAATNPSTPDGARTAGDRESDVPAPDGAASEGHLEIPVGGADVPPPAAQVPDILVDDLQDWER